MLYMRLRSASVVSSVYSAGITGCSSPNAAVLKVRLQASLGKSFFCHGH